MATTAEAEPTTTLTVRLPVRMRRELEQLAKVTGRQRNTLALEAISRFIDQQRWQIARIEEGVRQARAGIFVPDEEMDALWAEFGLEPDSSRENDVE